MNFRNIKTVLIIVLIIGVIFQTGRLWFEESSGHNFFVGLANRGDTQTEQRRIEPETIMTNIGGMIYFKAETDDEIKTLADGHIAQLMKNGRYIETVSTDWRMLLDFKAVVYLYPVLISPESFSLSFSEIGGDFRSKTDGFDALIIRPARSSSESMKIYVNNSNTGATYIFETQRGVSEPLSKEIDRLSRANPDSGLVYISSVQNGLDFFTDNVFLPQWQGAYTYLMPHISNPIEEAESFEKCALPFFDNPVGVLAAEDPAGAPFVSGRESVVKYYPNTGILEYTNYSSISNPRGTFGAAYSAAIAFMEKDQTLANDVVLTGAELIDGVWTLYFNYVWGGARIFTEAGYAIEITATDDTVIKYKRIPMRISTSDLLGELDQNFLTALDHLLANKTDKIDGLEPGYDASAYGVCKLEWFVEDGGTFERVYD